MDVLGNAKKIIANHISYPNHASVSYHNRRLSVSYKGGPSAASTQLVLADLVESTKTLNGVDVERTPIWACGAAHVDMLDAWAAHEGKAHLEPHGDPSYVNDPDEDVSTNDYEHCLSLDALRELLDRRETFTTTECTELPATDA